MKPSLRSTARKSLHQAIRTGLAALPQRVRFALLRSMVECDPAPDSRLELKIADTRDELEACFRLLHDAYVASGFMRPDPSGLRVTIYHALPTTTTLCAKFDGRVVGTLSLIREGVFGFPLQSVFDLSAVRAKPGRIAEVSALAIDPDFRNTGGAILFPLMKFMYEYCTGYFDTRHLLIAVNPNKIELYESLLFFERLQQQVVENYDFANGAPAVGATLDLASAAERFRHVYGGRPTRRNLHRYFVQTTLPNTKMPTRHYHTTNDPVMTPQMIEYFFMQKTRVFETLDDRKRVLLRSIYDLDAYATVLPQPAAQAGGAGPIRGHERYSINCPAVFEVGEAAHPWRFKLRVIQVSRYGFQAESAALLPAASTGRLKVELGHEIHSIVEARTLRRIDSASGSFYGFGIREPDAAWLKCVDALQCGLTHADLAVPPPAPRLAARGASVRGGPRPEVRAIEDRALAAD